MFPYWEQTTGLPLSWRKRQPLTGSVPLDRKRLEGVYSTRKSYPNYPYPSFYWHPAEMDNPANIGRLQANSDKYQNLKSVFMTTIADHQLNIHKKLLEAQIKPTPVCGARV